MARRLLTLAGVSSLLVSGLVGVAAPASAAPATPAVTYQNCLDVWNHIHRPINDWEPGFQAKFDNDDDGLGCENPPKGYVGPKYDPLPKPTPKPQPIAAPATRFRDVPNNRQFAAEINWLASKGVTTGYSDGTFRPAGTVDRGTMAAFFYRMAGKPSYTPPKKSPFKDVPTTHQFYKEISWMASKGISTGYADGTFRPSAKITRDAMAAFFYRLAGKPNYQVPARSAFRDVSTNRQFYKEISWMASKGISTGYKDGSFHPVNSITRDAMAAFIKRYDSNVKRIG